MNMDMRILDNAAVDSKQLATNFPEVIPDCSGLGAEPKSEIQNRFPLAMWLMNTKLSQDVRSAISRQGACVLHKDTDGNYVIEIPRSFWSEIPTTSASECCWVPFDFAKCAGNVPLNLLCLKDCIDIKDELTGMVTKFTQSYAPIANEGETYEVVRKRVARLSMAFYTAYTMILGMDNAATGILKPFHGLMSLMENPAVVTIYGADVLAAFDSAACRLSLLGGDASQYVFAMNPVVYQGLLTKVRPGQYGEYPDGWTRSGDEIRFRGIQIIQDNLVPVDITAGTGEIWVLANDAVGAYLMTDLQPADAFIKYSGHNATTPAEGCGNECAYYYNMGTTFNNNANKIMRIMDVPVSAACAAVIGDMGNLVMPQTLIPRI